MSETKVTEKEIYDDGWISTAIQPTYTSADAPSYVVTFANVTGKPDNISIGNKVKLTHASSTKYFIITYLATGGGGELVVNLYGGTDYTLTDSAITNFSFSMMKSPKSFPMNPAKWTVTTNAGDNPTKTSPTANTWYGGSNAWTTGTAINPVFPIGAWDVYGCASVTVILGSAGYTSVFLSLSSSNSTGQSPMLSYGFVYSTTQGSYFVSFNDVVNVTSKTTYYLLAKTDQTASSLSIQNSGTPVKILARCSYL